MLNINKSIENVVNGVTNTQYSSVIAEVTAFDGIKNRASVTFTDTNAKGIQVLDNVPVEIQGSGIHTAGPFIRDEVMVVFQNGSILQPKITAIIDEGYQYVTRTRLQHTDSGAYLNDPTNTVSTDDLPTNAINDWVDTTSDITNKYVVYKDANPISELTENTSNISYYSTTEPGITHPKTKATVKLKDDGNIDVFIDDNIGIRVNANTRSIDIYGDVNINGNLNTSGVTTKNSGTTNTDINSNGG